LVLSNFDFTGQTDHRPLFANRSGKVRGASRRRKIAGMGTWTVARPAGYYARLG